MKKNKKRTLNELRQVKTYGYTPPLPSKEKNKNMTKNDLINLITSLKIDLKYLKKDLDFRLRGNDVDATNEKYDGVENKYVYKTGIFEAMVKMDNDTFERAIKTIEEMEKSMAS